MYILKLPWLNHSEESHKHEVYSLSVSPDGTRLASGGLDGNVRIWSTTEILKYRNPKLPRDPATCRPLCSMARHTGAVTVVKFSPDGRFLASGSDDKVLLIWEKDEENRPSFGEQNLEHWTVTKRAVAHDNDIQDVAWAPDSSILVSVGLDRSIIIWNGNTFEKIKRFDVHQSHVKGVVFDPANKYFATSSDDRSVRIFRYHKGSEISFSIERTVLKPFRKSPLTTYYRRLSWSPDGQFIAVPNATNGPVTSVAVISRGSWESDISLIGHDSPCEVASFSPVLYEVPDPNKKKETKITSLLATAGQDKNLVIWNNAYSRAIAVFEEFSSKTITDLCWSPDGLTLYVSSLDGTISVINFEPGELGQVVSSQMNDELLTKYGVDKDSMVFPESTSQLLLEDKAAEFTKTLSEKHMDRLLMLEKPASPAPKPKSAMPSLIALPSPSTQLKPVQDKTKLNRVVLSNGKKRVAPTLISTTSHSTSRDSKFHVASVKTKTQIDLKATSKLSKSSYALPKFGLQTAVNPYFIKRTSADDREDEGEGDEIDDYEDLPEEEEYIAKRRRVRNNKLLKLHEPLGDSNILVKSLKDGEHSYVMEILNREENSTEDPTVILVHEDGDLGFEQFIQDRIVGITGQPGKFWALATDSEALLAFSPSGRMLLPRVELGANAAYITSKDNIVLVVTDDFMVHCYDIMNGKKVHKKVSLAPVVHHGSPFVGRKCEVHKRLLDADIKGGKVVVYLTTNDVYLYDAELKSWVRIIDSFYHEFNHYNAVWIDRTKHRRRGKDEDKEVEFTKRLTFLEGYELLMEKYLDNGSIVSRVKDELNTMYQEEMYQTVRASR